MASPTETTTPESRASALLAAQIDQELNAPRNLGCPHKPSLPLKDLSDEILEAILDRVPMQDLMSKFRICKKWDKIIEYFCRRKGSLLFYEKEYYVEDLERLHDRFFGNFSIHRLVNISVTENMKSDLDLLEAFKVFLDRYFPRPATVLFHIDTKDLFDQEFIIELLESWSKDLVTFSLCTRYESGEKAAFYYPISALSIFLNTKCFSLKRLDIYGFKDTFTNFHDLWPILGRVEQFSSDGSIRDYNDKIKNCRRLWCSYRCFDLTPEDIKHWVKRCPNLFANLTHLDISFLHSKKKAFSLLSHCPALKVLWMDLIYLVFDKENFTSLCEILDPVLVLKNLEELRLTIESLKMFTDPDSPPEDEPKNRVRKLTLRMQTRVPTLTPEDFVQNYYQFCVLANYFPNVEEVRAEDIFRSEDVIQYAEIFPKCRLFAYRRPVKWESGYDTLEWEFYIPPKQ